MRRSDVNWVDSVTDDVIRAVANAFEAFAGANPVCEQQMREFMTRHLWTHRPKDGWHFSKDYRLGATPLHELVYCLISTPAANSGSRKELDRFYGAVNSATR